MVQRRLLMPDFVFEADNAELPDALDDHGLVPRRTTAFDRGRGARIASSARARTRRDPRRPRPAASPMSSCPSRSMVRALQSHQSPPCIVLLIAEAVLGATRMPSANSSWRGGRVRSSMALTSSHVLCRGSARLLWRARSLESSHVDR